MARFRPQRAVPGRYRLPETGTPLRKGLSGLSNLLTRIIVAAIFGPLIILISYLGGSWLFGMVMLFGMIGIGEFMFGSGIRPKMILFWITSLFTAGMLAASMLLSISSGLLILTGYFIFLGMVTAVRNTTPSELFKQQSTLIWGVAYIGLLYPFVYMVRQLSGQGGDWMLFMFGTLWLSDTLAMFIGKAFGKRKLAPTVSPNKTIAGFIGGMTGGIIVAFILGFWRLSNIELPLLLMAGILISLVGQLGDLVESCWKRAIGIKDSSAIIPGHGGVLDRFDSLLFAAPVLYLFLDNFIYQ
ncbi:MAG: hypothetical protein CVT49_12610 [candidate division Zixibacteria bacterium HGW-Zixibacteria-1]|nr:MAG: hypothetical protein CVT49_12610 [candidate division Zixibacteria bacterium HGW-Zixibacteria-1]